VEEQLRMLREDIAVGLSDILLNFVLVAIHYQLSRITRSSLSPLLLLRTHRLGRQILDFGHKFKQSFALSFALFPACPTEHLYAVAGLQRRRVARLAAVTVDAAGPTCRGQKRARCSTCRFHL
jgi:hypothetical protein